MTNVGEMSELVDLLRPTNTLDASGQPITAWAKVVSIMAKVSPLSGRELFYAQQAMLEADVKVNFNFYPGIDSDFRVLVPEYWTELSAGVNSSVTTIPIVDYTVFSTKVLNYYAKLEDEIVKVTAGQGSTSLTVSRGQLGTSAASHAIATPFIKLKALDVKSILDIENRHIETEILCCSADLDKGL